MRRALHAKVGAMEELLVIADLLRVPHQPAMGRAVFAEHEVLRTESFGRVHDFSVSDVGYGLAQVCLSSYGGAI